MVWDEVIEALVAALEADTTLATALGATAADSRIGPIEHGEETRIPSVRYQVISDVEEETLNNVLVQFDYWAQNRNSARNIERRIRETLGARTRRSFGSLEMWVLYLDGRDMGDPMPGVVHRSLDFRCVPVRAGLTTS
jgi:hypothetical protein